jgi:predicted DCC family thiol-disulfide oxidoreductase YuxK
MKNSLLNQQSIFFYDGECRFCRSLALALKKRNQNPNLVFLSFRNFSDEDLLHLHPSLTEDMLESEVQLIHHNKRYPGFFAVRKITSSLKNYRYITPFLYLPLIPFLGMYVMYILKKYKSKS